MPCRKEVEDFGNRLEDRERSKVKGGRAEDQEMEKVRRKEDRREVEVGGRRQRAEDR